MLIYSFNEGGTEYLSQADYEFFIENMDKKDRVRLKDGRVLPTKGCRIHKNPDWVDEERDAKIRAVIEKNEAKLREKLADPLAFNPFAEYYKKELPNDKE